MNSENVSVTTSGVGEYLIKTIFAKKCASKLLKFHKQSNGKSLGQVSFEEVVRDTVEKNFLGLFYYFDE